MNIGSASRLAVLVMMLISTLLLAQGVAMAVSAGGTLTFIDLTDTVTVSDDTGRTSDLSCLGEACTVTLTGPTGTSPTTESFFTTWAEPGSNVVSDVVAAGVPDSGIGLSILFESDHDGVTPPLCPAGGCTGVETGLVQTAFTIQWKNTEGAVVATDTIAFKSDSETVPEPASALLLFTGVGVVAMARRRARRKTKA